MLATAFKEWAVVCRALAEGRQALILRKGGISEADGRFRPEHDRFLLYPTFFHEHRSGVQPAMLPLLEAAERDRPPAGSVRFTHFVEVATVRYSQDLGAVLRLAPLHGWTEETVRKRFAYREPGVFVLTVRAFALATPVDVVERPEYAGCKTWVQLDAPVPTAGAAPVLGDAAFHDYERAVASALGE